MAGQDTALQEQNLLHDKLREQITISITESLSKATAVLSSLHRVHSYLDVLKSLPSLGSDEGVKGALDQVKAIRTDTAALLQTIYLTEIGLQSMVDKPLPSPTSSSPVAVTTKKVTVVPAISDVIDDPLSGDIDDENDDGGAINSNSDDVIEGGESVLVDIDEGCADIVAPPVHPPPLQPATEDTPPPAKRQNFGVVVMRCVVCKRKYATDTPDPQMGGQCKICHSKGAPSNQTTVKSLLMTPDPVLSSTPRRLTPVGLKNKPRKVSSVHLTCKVCGTSFVYRRCLFRHLRENHPGIDLNNIHEYIEKESVANVISLADEEEDPQNINNSSLNVTVGSDAGTVSEVDDGAILEGQGSESSLEQLGGASESVKESEGGSRVNFDPSMKQVYTCDVCGKVFDRPYRLARHIDIHNPNRPRVSCQICDRTFTRFDTLENHVKSVHSNERPYQCQYHTCQKTFATHTALMSHLKYHTNGRPYQCFECNASFAHLSEYKAHAREKHADTEKLRCTDCYRVFPDTTSLEAHRSLEHLLECEICGKKFARLAYLQLHKQVHNGEKVYNCQVCSQGFDSEVAYRQHIRNHPKATRTRKFHCQLCDRDFEDMNLLIAHYRCSEHRDKATALGLSENTTLLNTIEGDLSSEMNALVNEVAMAANSIPMETTPVSTETDQVSLDNVNPVEVLREMEEQAAVDMMSSAIAQGNSFSS